MPKNPKHSETMKLYWANKENRIAHSKKMKDKWSDEDFRNAQGDLIREGILSNPNEISRRSNLAKDLNKNGIISEGLKKSWKLRKEDSDYMEKDHIWRVEVWTEERRNKRRQEMKDRLPTVNEVLRNGPNNLEKHWIRILETYFPNQFIFTGSGKDIKSVGGKFPDFTHRTNNKLIEIFGSFWHKGNDGSEKVRFFKELGYDTLIIWEFDNEEQSIERIRNFLKT